MRLSTATYGALAYIVFMIAALVLLALAGAGLGPVEFVVWFVILVVGLALIVAGTNRTRQMEK